MKILFLNNQRKYRGSGRGHSRYWNWEFFREELGKRVDVLFYGWGYNPEWKKNQSLIQVIEKFGKPDIILSHRNFHNCKDYNKITDILKVHIAGDYYNGNWKLPKLKKSLQGYNFDLVFGYSNQIVQQLQKDQIGRQQFLLPFGVNQNVFRNLKLTKKYDVAAFYTTRPDVYPYRLKIQEMIQKMKISIWIKQAWLDDAITKINQSRICINSNARFKFVNPRVTEVLSCGTFLLTDKTEELIKFGYKNGVHLIMFDDLVDLKEKILYYLDHEEERENIAQNGMKFVRSTYSNEKIIERFIKIIQKESLN